MGSEVTLGWVAAEHIDNGGPIGNLLLLLVMVLLAGYITWRLARKGES